MEEGDIPGTPNTLPHNILSELYVSSTRAVGFVSKNMHGAG